MPLVEGLAHRHERRGAEHDDLVQAGSIGLLNAIERFDPKRGEEFVAFAVPTVAGEMKRHLRDRAAIVRLPRSLHEASVQLPRARESLTPGWEGRRHRAELAAELGVSRGRPRAAREHDRASRRGDGRGLRVERARGKRGAAAAVRRLPHARRHRPNHPLSPVRAGAQQARGRRSARHVAERARPPRPTPRCRSCAPSWRAGRSPRRRRAGGAGCAGGRARPSRARRAAVATAGG